ncbi:MAG: prepilin-type N-terminal cleavage/methylation domain-containing protein [Acidobacteriota bacterium]
MTGAGRLQASGFTLIEVLVSMLVLTVALVGLLSVFTQAIVVTSFGQDDLIAKQKAREALESIYTARNTNQISFSMIRGVSRGGIFVEGFQPLYTPGPDGLLATVDDAEPETMVTPGSDGMVGTPDDEIRSLNAYQREVVIQESGEDLRKVTVTVRYRGGRGIPRDYQISSFVSRFR